MDRLTIGLVLIALLGSNAASSAQEVPNLPASPSSGNVVIVPGGTPLTVRLISPVSSDSSHADDDFQFRATENVVVDGWIVIAKDAIGEGAVASVDPAGSHGHPGQLKLQFDWVYGADGLKIKLSGVPSTSNGEGAQGTSSTATVLSTILLGPVGLFAHNFVKGKNVTIDTSRKIPLYVADTVHISARAHPSTGDDFAH